MLRVGFVTFVTLVFMAKTSSASNGRCTQVYGDSGTIRNEKTASTYSKCWKITVPQNSVVEIYLESFQSYDCTISKVEISLYNEDETHVFCPKTGYPKPLILKDDLTVTHMIRHPYYEYKSEFLLSYQIIRKLENSLSVGPEGSESRTLVVPGLTESRIMGIQWLKDKWSFTTGWQENTHRGVTALFLASDRDEKEVNIEELMIKQLEVQTLVYIMRKDTDEFTVNQLSMFINALTVSCQNLRNFHGKDLVKMLKDEVEVSATIDHPVAYLALCNAGEALPANVTDDLNRLLKANTEYPFLLEIQAMTFMALSCLRTNYGTNSNTSFPEGDYEEAISKFKALQRDDGSFGNIYTTAAVTQALLSAGQESTTDWNYNKAINYLMQHLNSASDDFLALYLILPILNGKCLADIRNTNCSMIAKRDPVSDVKAKLGPKRHVKYYLIFGVDEDISHVITLRVPQNVTVFEVMQLAQDADAKYKFQVKQMGEKLYIYEIAGVTNDFEDDKFWLLYVGKEAPSMRQANESPDKIILQDGEHIVMWYKGASI